MEKNFKKKNGMSDMISLFVGVMEFDDLLSGLEESIANYKIAKTEENKGKLVMHCALIMKKDIVIISGDGIEGALKVNEKVKCIERSIELFMPEKN